MNLTTSDRAFCRKQISTGKSYSEYCRLAQGAGFNVVAKGTYEKTERVIFNNLNGKWKHLDLTVLRNAWIAGESMPPGKRMNQMVRYAASRAQQSCQTVMKKISTRGPIENLAWAWARKTAPNLNSEGRSLQEVEEHTFQGNIIEIICCLDDLDWWQEQKRQANERRDDGAVDMKNGDQIKSRKPRDEFYSIMDERAENYIGGVFDWENHEAWIEGRFKKADISDVTFRGGKTGRGVSPTKLIPV